VLFWLVCAVYFFQSWELFKNCIFHIKTSLTLLVTFFCDFIDIVIIAARRWFCSLLYIDKTGANYTSEHLSLEKNVMHFVIALQEECTAAAV